MYVVGISFGNVLLFYFNEIAFVQFKLWLMTAVLASKACVSNPASWYVDHVNALKTANSISVCQSCWS